MFPLRLWARGGEGDRAVELQDEAGELMCFVVDSPRGSACSPKLLIERRTCSPHRAEV